jgi:hypothetical protein
VIIRVFRPTIHPGKESEFESFLRETAAACVAAVGDRCATCGQAS